MNDKNENNTKSFWDKLERLAWLLFIIFALKWYFNSWFNALKGRQYIKFLLMSILPVIAIYYMQHNMLYGHPPRGWDNPYMDYDNCNCKWTLMDIFI